MRQDELKNVKCATCGSSDLTFTYSYLYSMGSQNPVAKQGEIVCEKCGHRARHTEWMSGGSREEVVEKVATAVERAGAEFVGGKFSWQLKARLEDAIFQVVAREASLFGLQPPRVKVVADGTKMIVSLYDPDTGELWKGLA